MKLINKIAALRNKPMLISPEACQQFFSTIERLQAGKVDKNANLMEFLFGIEEKQNPATQDGVVVIPVMGVLTNRSWWGDNYMDIAAQLNMAVSDSSVRHIVLDIDSNGGEVDGAFDLGEAIYNARGEKPITAIVADNANSAAYLIASAANEVVLGKTGEVGSVGVVATHVDYSGFLKKEGIVYTHVFAGEHKVDASSIKPLSDDAKERIQDEVNTLYAMFTEAVARYRGLSVDAVVATQASIYMGQKAIDIGFADTLASYEETMSKITQSLTKPAKSSTQGDVTMTTETVVENQVTTKPAANHDEMALIVEACDKSGVSYLAAGFIRSEASMEQVQERLAEVKKIRTACGLAHAADQSDSFIKQGMKLEEVQQKLLNRMANADDKTRIDSTSTPDQLYTDNKDKMIGKGWDKAFSKVGAKIKAA